MPAVRSFRVVVGAVAALALVTAGPVPGAVAVTLPMLTTAGPPSSARPLEPAQKTWFGLVGLEAVTVTVRYAGLLVRVPSLITRETR